MYVPTSSSAMLSAAVATGGTGACTRSEMGSRNEVRHKERLVPSGTALQSTATAPDWVPDWVSLWCWSACCCGLWPTATRCILWCIVSSRAWRYIALAGVMPVKRSVYINSERAFLPRPDPDVCL